jgi:hypothetical protein
MRQVVMLGDLVGRLERLEIRCRRCERRGRIRLARLIEAYLAGTTFYRGLRVFMAVHRERLKAVFSTALRRAPAVNTLRALLPCCQEQCARGGRFHGVALRAGSAGSRALRRSGGDAPHPLPLLHAASLTR